ncbi:PilZ domain-containing protein [Sphingomonas sp.]|jgi:hypothetical protein|uniref:PilZ domain-containing protein n=1 Tax=Sphingomonas sp. TaxID=28214 RepID=UPI002D80F40A|nr:PilZ domain-containing protein [Sphingomonas sp.]HEU0044660.1 PilZ domain-containing protein [Sphingomonas sp.]
MATRVAFSRRESAYYDQRNEPRHRVECVRATAGGETEESFVAQLEDISTFGCRLIEAEPLESGKRIWLRLPHAAPITARVAWASDGRAGCRFDTPISQGLMRSLLLRAAVH